MIVCHSFRGYLEFGIIKDYLNKAVYGYEHVKRKAGPVPVGE